MTKEQKRLVEEQFAIDYNCAIEDFQNKKTLVTVRKEKEGARKFKEESFLSILSYNGKLVINAAVELIPWCEEVLKERLSAEWCFEADSLISKVPYAGTALSHNASQSISLRAGLVLSFCELRSVKID